LRKDSNPDETGTSSTESFRRAAAQARQLVSHGKAQAPRRTGYAHRLVAASNKPSLLLFKLAHAFVAVMSVRVTAFI
jgi:hypothetical protein